MYQVVRLAMSTSAKQHRPAAIEKRQMPTRRHQSRRAATEDEMREITQSTYFSPALLSAQDAISFLALISYHAGGDIIRQLHKPRTYLQRAAILFLLDDEPARGRALTRGARSYERDYRRFYT